MSILDVARNSFRASGGSPGTPIGWRPIGGGQSFQSFLQSAGLNPSAGQDFTGFDDSLSRVRSYIDGLGKFKAGSANRLDTSLRGADQAVSRELARRGGDAGDLGAIQAAAGLRTDALSGGLQKEADFQLGLADREGQGALSLGGLEGEKIRLQDAERNRLTQSALEYGRLNLDRDRFNRQRLESDRDFNTQRRRDHLANIGPDQVGRPGFGRITQGRSYNRVAF